MRISSANPSGDPFRAQPAWSACLLGRLAAESRGLRGLIIETTAGTFVREIRSASLLDESVDRGAGAEQATRMAAAYWGLPDFMFRPAMRRRGHGVRELGDAIVVVGPRALSVQVKARVALSTDDDRERRWLDKKIVEGSRQASGTVRSLLTAGRAVRLVNERDREIEIDARTRSWVNVVVLDHPGIDGYVPTGPAVVLLRRDWEFLFEQLKSTYAVVEYLHRISSTAPIKLGTEAVRYYEFAAADAAAPVNRPDPRLAALGFNKPTSLPLLPQAPAGHGDDRDHAIVRGILEDVAVTGVVDEDGRLNVLAAIDAIPVAYRAELGRTVVRWLDEVGVPEPGLIWRFRNLPWPGRPYLLLGATTRLDERVQREFNDFIALRHQQQMELMPERADAMTVGILLTRRADGLRPWDTTVAATRGDQGFDPRFRRFLDRLWGPLGGGGGRQLTDDDWDELA